jgi:hypothetical protein
MVGGIRASAVRWELATLRFFDGDSKPIGPDIALVRPRSSSKGKRRLDLVPEQEEVMPCFRAPIRFFSGRGSPHLHLAHLFSTCCSHIFRQRVSSPARDRHH